MQDVIDKSIERSPATARSILYRLLFIYSICGSLTVIIGFIYFIVGMEVNRWQAILIFSTIPLSFVLMFIFDSLTITYLWLPIRILLSKPISELTQVKSRKPFPGL